MFLASLWQWLCQTLRLNEVSICFSVFLLSLWLLTVDDGRPHTRWNGQEPQRGHEDLGGWPKVSFYELVFVHKDVLTSITLVVNDTSLRTYCMLTQVRCTHTWRTIWRVGFVVCFSQVHQIRMQIDDSSAGVVSLGPYRESEYSRYPCFSLSI